MNAPATNLPAERRELAPIESLKRQLTSRAEEFKMVLPAHITPEKFQRVLATAALQNPQLLNCDRQSLLLASMKLAQDGLLPDGREAALVPFKSWDKTTEPWTELWLVQPMPMVYGLRKKILQSGEVLSIETGVVYMADYESGRFLYEIGQDPPVRYRPDLMLDPVEMTDEKIIAAYSIAKIKNEASGTPYWSVEVMRRVEIDKVRQTSQTGAVGRTYSGGKNKGKPIKPSGPWVDWFSEMARKTVLRRHSKVLPMSGDILETLERDIESERAADRAAESAAAYLAQGGDTPILPRREDRDDGGDDRTEDVVDNETGEVTKRDSRGMTEVSEEEARALDAAQASDGTLSEDNPSAQEGADDSQKGEDQPDAAEQEKAAAGAAGEEPDYLPKIRALRTKLGQAKTLKAVDGIDRDWCNALRGEVEQADEGLMQSVDRDINSKRRELRAQSEG